MKIFQLQDNLVKINEEKFSKEKPMQKLVEKNLDVLFPNMEYVDTEVKIDNVRFDTLAFDPQQMSFIIIEYKKVRTDSLTQGIDYIHKLKKNKVDIIGLYQEKKKQVLDVKNIVWDKTRVIFIAPEFTKRQISAIEEEDKYGTKHYEIKQYQNGIITFNKLGEPEPDDSTANGRSGPNELDSRSEEEYLKSLKIPTAIRDLWEELREATDEYLTDIKYIQKSFGSYVVNNKPVCRLIARQNYILLVYRTQDRYFLAEDEFVKWIKYKSSKVGRHKSIIKNTDDIKKTLPLIKKVYNSKKQ